MKVWLHLVIVSALLLIVSLPCVAQGSLEDFRTLLREQASFSADEISAIEASGNVVKLLPVNDKREVAICGVSRLPGQLSEVLKALNDSMALRSGRSVNAKGKFSNPPSLKDVETLILEDQDIEDLRECVVGECEVKVSASMIRRFQDEVDWTKADYRLQATRLFRQMLVEYVRDYLSRGDVALIEYHDQQQSIRLQDEQDSLLSQLLYINEFAPELKTFMQGFPAPSGAKVDSQITWATIKFGLKPSIVVSHVITYAPPKSSQLIVITKQIYASHYFDSSLGLTAVVSFPLNGGATDSYLLYTNRSRADALDGPFSKLKRNVSESEAVESLQALLERTRLTREINASNQGTAAPTVLERVREWLFGGNRVYLWLIAIVGMLSLLLLIKRKPDVWRFDRDGGDN